MAFKKYKFAHKICFVETHHRVWKIWWLFPLRWISKLPKPISAPKICWVGKFVRVCSVFVCPSIGTNTSELHPWMACSKLKKAVHKYLKHVIFGITEFQHCVCEQEKYWQRLKNGKTIWMKTIAFWISCSRTPTRVLHFWMMHHLSGLKKKLCNKRVTFNGSIQETNQIFSNTNVCGLQFSSQTARNNQ